MQDAGICDASRPPGGGRLGVRVYKADWSSDGPPDGATELWGTAIDRDTEEYRTRPCETGRL